MTTGTGKPECHCERCLGLPKHQRRIYLRNLGDVVEDLLRDPDWDACDAADAYEVIAALVHEGALSRERGGK